MIVPGRAIPLLGGVRVSGRLLSRAIRRSIAAVLQWEDRRRQRQALLHLSDAMLKDIGLSRAELDREADKPFWLP
jgi:uncharacterized protein YjiS (DUF1127 family)